MEQVTKFIFEMFMVAILTIDIVFEDLMENELFDLAFDQNKFLVNGLYDLIGKSSMKDHRTMITVWNPYEPGCGHFYGDSYRKQQGLI